MECNHCRKPRPNCTTPSLEEVNADSGHWFEAMEWVLDKTIKPRSSFTACMEQLKKPFPGQTPYTPILQPIAGYADLTI